MKYKKILVVLGFVFASLSFLSPLILKFWFDLLTPQQMLSMAQTNPFPPFARFVNPPIFGVLGMFMAWILKRSSDEGTKKWGNRIIWANLIAAPLGVVLLLISVIF